MKEPSWAVFLSCQPAVKVQKFATVLQGNLGRQDFMKGSSQ
jgi:hypothetical protein